MVTCNECPKRAGCKTLCKDMKAELGRVGPEELPPTGGGHKELADTEAGAVRNRADAAAARLQDVEECMGLLTKRQYRVWRERMWAGYTFREIAAGLGVDVAAVYRTWRRAQAKIKTYAARMRAE